MESSGTLSRLPFHKAPRKGQRRVVDKALEPNTSEVNVQLPTGYGKTYAACCTYAALLQHRRVNRVLYIVTSDAQLKQFAQDGPSDMRDAGVDTLIDSEMAVIDIGFFRAPAIKYHRNNTHHIFAVTVQALIKEGAWSVVVDLLQTGRWMIVIDEYHHYGLDAEWGRKVAALNYEFRLAMSATPYRPGNDSAFGPPDVVVTYRKAVGDGAVKPLKLHSYVYRVDVSTKGGVVSYTTGELIEQAGSDSPEAIDKFMLENHMRWSIKYVSPLVTIPVERMLAERLRTGETSLQVLVGTMSCSHAKSVCEQIRSLFNELRVDWVGTGNDGRKNDVNADVLKKFCPPKNAEGRRPPGELDILVHVGMAGEGLDCINVTEVVQLNQANINNTNNQEFGRASRTIRGIQDVKGHINVDACSPYAQYPGGAIMSVLDGALDPTALEPEDENNKEPSFGPESNFDFPPIPDEPVFLIHDMECIRIDDGEAEEILMETLKRGGNMSKDEFIANYRNLSEHDRNEVLDVVKEDAAKKRQEQQRKDNLKAQVEQLDKQVETLVSRLTSNVCGLISFQNPGMRMEKSFRGDVKKRINTQKSIALGKKTKDMDVLMSHWYWLQDLRHQLETTGIPPWLV